MCKSLVGIYTKLKNGNNTTFCTTDSIFELKLKTISLFFQVLQRHRTAQNRLLI